MKVAIFGATGALGSECLVQCLESGHEVRVLVRNAGKLPESLRDRIAVIEGDALDAGAVEQTLAGAGEGAVEAILFAIGVDEDSPEDLCTDVTRHIFELMPRLGIRRFVWCGGGSNPVPEDQLTLGSKFVELFARTFMGLRHRDKAHQLDFLNEHQDIDWIGVRPLQMKQGPRRGEYRLGFDAYSGLSKIHFADCAHAMVGMLVDGRWLHKAPIIQY